METDNVVNWKKKIALQIETYARVVFDLDDLSKNDFYTADAIEYNCYETITHMLNKLFNGNFNDEVNEFIFAYSEYKGKSLREIGEETAFKMLEAFKKIFSGFRKETL